MQWIMKPLIKNTLRSYNMDHARATLVFWGVHEFSAAEYFHSGTAKTCMHAH